MTLTLLVGMLLAAVGTQSWPLTRAERSGYRETSHYEDVVQFLDDLMAAGAPINVQWIGTSTGGRRIPLVIASYPPVSTPEEGHKLGRPIVYIQANIHAGEVEGKEAAQIILRRLSQAGPSGPLSRYVLLVTPIYNIDGNEKFAPVAVNRPEQDGPEMVGVRENGQGLDLNRDAIKAEAPETRAVLEHVYTAWNPEVMMDLHTTDGTRHGYELTYSPPLNPNTEPDAMRLARDEALPWIRSTMRARYHKELFDYGNVESRGGKRAWYTFGQEGRYCTNYVGLRNRLSFLSEAATFIPFQDRISATDEFASLILEWVAAHSGEVMRVTRNADRRVEGWGRNPKTAPRLGVRFQMASRGVEPILLEKASVSGRGSATRPTAIEEVAMPVYDRFRAVRSATFPAGYVVPASEEATVELLKRHGIRMERVEAEESLPVLAFTVQKAVVAARPFQNHKLVMLDGAYRRVDEKVPAGSYLVPTSQPLGILAFNILEPESDDGAVAWGFVKDWKEGSDLPILKVLKLPGSK